MSSRALFGGAITCDLPESYVDISHLHEVSNSQEVLNEGDTDACFILDIVEYAAQVPNENIAQYYFEDNADLNQAKSFTLERATVLENGMQLISGVQTGVVKGRERDPEGSTIHCFLAVKRLPEHAADLILTLAFPVKLSASSALARVSGLHPKPLAQAQQEFMQACATLQVVDEKLFA